MHKTNNDVLPVDLTQALRVWAKKKNVRPVDLSNAMGWSPSYAWEVLRGKHTFSLEAHGRFIFIYGMDELKEIYRIAKIEPKGIVDLEPA